MELLGMDPDQYMSQLEWLMEELTLEKLLNTFSFGFDGAVDVAVYVFTALAIYTIAKRRRFDKPWLAWIPVVRDWLVGSLSDQYQLHIRGKVTNRRKWLLGMQGVLIGGVILTVIMVFAVIWNILAAGYNNYAGEYDELKVWSSLGCVILLCIVMSAATIIRTVLFHMSLYDIYRSCQPKNATLFTVLGVFFGFLVPVFLMVCKDKDEGMYVPQIPREPWQMDP